MTQKTKKEYNEKYERTKKGLSVKMYHAMIWNIKSKKKICKLQFNLQEFRGWLFSQFKFNALFSEWIDRKYKKEYKPSIDRTDCNEHYSLGNISLMTWEQNRMKGLIEAYSKINRRGKPNVVGVRWTGKSWRARIRIKGREKNLGFYRHKIEAIEARKKEEEKLIRPLLSE